MGVLESEKTQITFPNITVDCSKIVEMECVKTLQKIKDIIENDSLSDFECIEEIICIFEDLGSNGGNRNDFG